MNFLLINGTESSNPSSLKKVYNSIQRVYPPLGLLYVGSALEEEGHKAEILDFFVEKDPLKKIEKNVKYFDAVGISVNRDYYYEAEDIAKKIKEIDPSIHIVIGGQFCSLYPKKSLEYLKSADISVDGDGEQAIKDIANVFSGHKKISEVAGVHYREDNEIKSGRPTCNIIDLDSISFPARHLVDKYVYGKAGDTDFYKQKVTSMITARGCPFKCRYCVRPTIAHNQFRKRSVKNVIQEFEEINGKYGTVIIADDTFLSDKKRSAEILDKIIEIGSDMDLWVTTRVDNSEKGIYKKMKKAGVKYITFGIESGNQDVLDYYNKGTNLNQIKKAVELSKKMGFISAGNFMLGAPIETKEHIENTIKFACSLPLDFVGFTPLHYQFGSDIWNEAVEKGLLNRDEDIVVADINRGLGNFTKEELKEFRIIGLRKFYFRPRYYFQQLIKAVYRRNFKILKIGLKYRKIVDF